MVTTKSVKNWLTLFDLFGINYIIELDWIEVKAPSSPVWEALQLHIPKMPDNEEGWPILYIEPDTPFVEAAYADIIEVWKFHNMV